MWESDVYRIIGVRSMLWCSATLPVKSRTPVVGSPRTIETVTRWLEHSTQETIDRPTEWARRLFEWPTDFTANSLNVLADIGRVSVFRTHMPACCVTDYSLLYLNTVFYLHSTEGSFEH